MAISTLGVTLKMGESAEALEKVVDIKDFPDLIGDPNMLETTTLSDEAVTNIPGIPLRYYREQMANLVQHLQ